MRLTKEWWPAWRPKDIGKTYDTAKVIVAHCGGGISIGAHDHGRVIEVNDSTGDG